MQSTGIYQKLIRVFVLQMLFISLITALGVYAAAIIVEQVMIRTALESEAKHYWALQAENGAYPTPNTYNLRGYLARAGDMRDVPAVLHAVQPGFGRVQMDDHQPIVYVEDRQAERLYLIFDEQSVGKLSFYFGVVPLSIALMVIYASAWLAYRLSRRTLSPLVSLAQTMRRFDLGKHALDSLHLDDFTRPGVDDEVRALAESLQEFTARLRKQLQREREFTRDVSHELRTPLAVIRGSLEVLAKQKTLMPLQQRALDRMQTTSRDMLSLIETLLLLAREQDKQVSQHEPIAVNDLVRLLLEQVAATHNADQHVSLQMREEQVLNVAAPPQALGIVIGNLLRNACNYTPGGSVVVTVGQRGVTVSDTGSGIAPGELARVQQPFERMNEEAQGYGLGLDIVRRLCERFGWTLVITSDQGQGTRVRVDFI